MAATISSLILGLWLTVSPAFLPMHPQAANLFHITGPLAITFSIIALWDINRNAVKVNAVIGVAILVFLFLLPGLTKVVGICNGLAAVVLVVLALKKRAAKSRYGGGWRSLFQHHPVHLQEAEKAIRHAE